MKKSFMLVEWPTTQGEENLDSTWRMAIKVETEHEAKMQTFGIDVPEMVVYDLGTRKENAISEARRIQMHYSKKEERK